jgi:hypothetical protein
VISPASLARLPDDRGGAGRRDFRQEQRRLVQVHKAAFSELHVIDDTRCAEWERNLRKVYAELDGAIRHVWRNVLHREDSMGNIRRAPVHRGLLIGQVHHKMYRSHGNCSSLGRRYPNARHRPELKHPDYSASCAGSLFTAQLQLSKTPTSDTNRGGRLQRVALLSQVILDDQRGRRSWQPWPSAFWLSTISALLIGKHVGTKKGPARCFHSHQHLGGSVSSCAQIRHRKCATRNEKCAELFRDAFILSSNAYIARDSDCDRTYNAASHRNAIRISRSE